MIVMSDPKSATMIDLTLSLFLGMQVVGEEGVPFRELSTQHLLLSTGLLMADSCFRFLFLGRLEIQDPRPDDTGRRLAALFF